MKGQETMKRVLTVLMLLIFLAASAAVAEEAAPYYSSVGEVTIEKLTEMTIPETILRLNSAFRADFVFRENDLEEEMKYSLRYLRNEDITQYNQFADYQDGTRLYIYFSTDPADGYFYASSGDSASRSELSSEDIDSVLNSSLFTYGSFDSEIIARTDRGDSYEVKVKTSSEGSVISVDQLIIDPVTGFVLSAETESYLNGEPVTFTTVSFTYDIDKIDIDDSPYTDYTEQRENIQASDISALQTTDIYGNKMEYDDISGANLIMINFWEPWCGPCLAELPDLEKLFETYGEKGLLILGVWSTPDVDQDVLGIVKDTGITYPVIRNCEALNGYTTMYVPTTVFADAEGKIISEEPYIGSRSYEDWENIILSYLGDEE